MSGSGILIYKKDEDDNINYLVLKSIDKKGILKNRCYDIPKGSIDPGENYYESAIRELNEEAGLSTDDIIFLKNSNGEIINFKSPLSDNTNSLVLMIAKLKVGREKNITLDLNPYDEHESYSWKNFYTCENECLYFLKDIFSLGESLIKNYEY